MDVCLEIMSNLINGSLIYTPCDKGDLQVQESCQQKTDNLPYGEGVIIVFVEEDDGIKDDSAEYINLSTAELRDVDIAIIEPEGANDFSPSMSEWTRCSGTPISQTYKSNLS